MYDILQLNEMLVPELKDIAENLGMKSYKRLSKKDLIYRILDEQAVTDKVIEAPAKPVAQEEPKPQKKEHKPRAPKKESAPTIETTTEINATILTIKKIELLKKKRRKRSDLMLS